MSNSLIVGGVKAHASARTGLVGGSKNITGVITKKVYLIGAMSIRGALNGSINGTKCLAGSIAKKAKLIGSLAIAYNAGATIYTGEYEVTPKMEEQVLNTAMKMMHKDVCVRSIPIHRISNASGGTTVYIGKEVL